MCYVNYEQDNWADLLPFAEVAQIKPIEISTIPNIIPNQFFLDAALRIHEAGVEMRKDRERC